MIDIWVEIWVMGGMRRRVNSMCKGFVGGIYLIRYINSKEVREVGVEWIREYVVGDEGRGVDGN